MKETLRAQAGYDLRRYLLAIRTEFVAEGYAVELKVSDRKVVQSAFVRFLGLPHELELSPRRDEVLAVKLEVDTNPPAGAGLETTVVRRHVVMQLQHHLSTNSWPGLPGGRLWPTSARSSSRAQILRS